LVWQKIAKIILVVELRGESMLSEQRKWPSKAWIQNKAESSFHSWYVEVQKFATFAVKKLKM